MAAPQSATHQSDEDLERQKQRRRAAMATPVADEGDVAFGGMVGIAVLAAIITASFAFFGFGGFGSETVEVATVVVPPVTEPAQEGLDLPAILSTLNDAGFEGIELSASDDVVTARGVVADEPSRAEVLALIGSQPFVVDVIDELSIEQPDEVAVGVAAAVLDANDDGIVLQGTVPSEQAADDLRAIAAQAYDTDQITDRLEILEGAESATITLNGTLTDVALGGALEGALGELGAADVTNNLVIEADASEAINDVLELEPILFQSGTAIILPESQSTLEEAAAILKQFPDSNVEIGGHTDSLGPEGPNQALSENRAQAVLAALRDLGVTNQLSAVGYGESQLKIPDDKGDTPDKIAARQTNRRIEFRTL
ncbi:MAG: OmpA family protein [Acidimicrobiales bacterium]|nr:OmpA family protein [Acidimicrobiales bacterium]